MSERNFESLRIWQDAREFVNDIYHMMQHCKDYGFRDQIQRAAVSIMNNIAEGNEAGSDAKYIYFLNIAKGSCSEVRSMLYLCQDFGFCTADEHQMLQTSTVKESTFGPTALLECLPLRQINLAPSDLWPSHGV